ncbi:Double-strand break repair protein MRE11 [Astathelohania contejeani]|uniref:Double-strand break repair protein MRE11 n=1 Tax=Astathelohania contejeani TaxID=164912 RepID=A0ABQ7HVA7_9MICR|nr:Double-strand break repair protein MRE11 [Thelohania contejeani]
MKILFTSDNHLGYKERDEHQSLDSFITFEEILKIAKSREVDLILQGGDLFHDNQPSRHTLNRTIELIKKYCLGSKDIIIESNYPLNYEDENLNVAIPILCIHGNHDDPSGLGSLSALNILASAGLVNYFGKTDNVDKIEIKPILLKKPLGDTAVEKVAIYGLGYIKDRRLYRTFLQEKVSYHRPKDYGEWYNIMLVHQNRIPHGDKDNLPDDFIDEMFDLVIYGHEHDNIIYRNEKKDFTVLQGGSTIRTSLCEGERGDKYVYLIEIVNSKLRIETIKLYTVRPFLMDKIKIVAENDEGIIKEKVEYMLRKNEKTSLIPLVRLKVESDGLSINKHKFGIPYKEKIANYKDILKFNRIKKKKEIDIDSVNLKKKTELTDIVTELFSEIELNAIPECYFIDSVKKFITKNEKNCFEDMIKNVINNVKDKFIDGDELIEIKRLKNDINREMGYRINNELNQNTYNEDNTIKQDKENDENVDNIARDIDSKLYDISSDTSNGLTFTNLL